MKLIIILLALALLVVAGVAEASPVKYSPSLNFYHLGHPFNFSNPINSSDAATFGGLNAANVSAASLYLPKTGGTFTGNTSQGGYTQTSQLAPTTFTKVFEYTVPWFGSKYAVALRSDGLPISVSTNNSTVLQAAIEQGGKVYLYNNFTSIAATLVASTSVSIEGIGVGSGIAGSVDPLIKTGTSTSATFDISNLKMTASATNSMIVLEKTYSSSILSTISHIRNVEFYSSAATTGKYAIESPSSFGVEVSGCSFHSADTAAEASWGGTFEGIHLTGNASTAAQAWDIHDNNFYYCKYAVNAIGANAKLEDIRVHDNEMMACLSPLYFQRCVEPWVYNNNMDNNENIVVTFASCQSPHLVNNWIWNRAAAQNAVNILSEASPGQATYRPIVAFNDIGNYATTPTGSGIALGATTNSIYDGVFVGNNICHEAYGYFMSSASSGYVNGNTFLGDHLNTCTAYGYVLGAGCDNNHILYPVYTSTTAYANNGANNAKNANEQAL